MIDRFDFIRYDYQKKSFRGYHMRCLLSLIVSGIIILGHLNIVFSINNESGVNFENAKNISKRRLKMPGLNPLKFSPTEAVITPSSNIESSNKLRLAIKP